MKTTTIALMIIQQGITTISCQKPQNTINRLMRNALYKKEDPAAYPFLRGEQYKFLIGLTREIKNNFESHSQTTPIEILQRRVDRLTPHEYFLVLPGIPSLFILQAMNKEISDQKNKIDLLLPNILAICNKPKSKKAKEECTSGLKRILLGSVALVAGSLIAYTSYPKEEESVITTGAFFGIPLGMCGIKYTYCGTQEVISGLRTLFW